MWRRYRNVGRANLHLDRCPTSQRTVILCHPHALVREGLARVLSEMSFQVAQAKTVAEAIRAAKGRGADLMLVSKDSLEDGPSEIKDLAGAREGMVVAVIAKPEQQGDIAALLQAGAYGYLSFGLTPDELNSSVTLLIAGDIVVSRDLAGDMSTTIGVSTEETVEDRLSQREREVLGLVAAGKTNREIAQELIVTESTVKVHLRNVLDKLNLRNRQQAAAYAAREGMLDDAAESHLMADTGKS